MLLLKRTILLFICVLLYSNFSQATILNDKGQINATSMYKIVNVEKLSDIVTTIQTAKKLNKSISILAVQHHQGGQTLEKNGIGLNMLPYNHVLSIDPVKMQVTVEPGITWDKLQQAINPYNLAIGVMQSSAIFSVGDRLA